ncbi:MAG: pantothenate kinase, partial [Bacteroidota bacterium]
NSTGNSILSGVQTGIIGEINYQIQLFNEKFPASTVFLTGGDAPLLSELLKTQIFVQPLLVHYGLFHAID